jgi:DNA-binding XRE family transcriptional regulator
MEDWAQRVKDYRARNGITQQALAEDLGVDRTTISRWETARDEPALMYRRKLMALTPSFEEGVVRGLIDFIDNLDGLATLLDANFRVLRTTRKHQELMGYDPGEVYGQSCERYWSAEMEGIIKHLGGFKGYRKHGIYQMDLALVRQPGEGGFQTRKPLISVGRTVAVGDPREPVCHLTTLRLARDDEVLPPCLIKGIDGPIAYPN